MKAVAKIWMFLILAMQFVPCDDLPQLQASAYSVLEVERHMPDTAQIEDCTPFCYCYCCSVPLSDSKDILLNELFVAFAPSYQEFRNKAYFHPNTSIWQPPKLA